MEQRRGRQWAQPLRAGLHSASLRCAGPESWGKLAGRPGLRQAGRMNALDNELQRHYGLLLGIQSPWQVKDVKLELEQKPV